MNYSHVRNTVRLFVPPFIKENTTFSYDDDLIIIPFPIIFATVCLLCRSQIFSTVQMKQMSSRSTKTASDTQFQREFCKEGPKIDERPKTIKERTSRTQITLIHALTVIGALAHKALSPNPKFAIKKTPPQTPVPFFHSRFLLITLIIIYSQVQNSLSGFLFFLLS